MVGILILIVGGVVAFVSLSNKEIKIEKVGDTYTFWKKEKIEIKDNLIKEVIEISSKLDRLNVDKKYFINDFYDACVRSCPWDCEIDIGYMEDFYNITYSKTEKTDYIKGCSDFCPQTCQTEIEYQTFNINLEIERLSNKEEIISEAIK